MARKGYKQTPEHVAARISRGKDHPNWKGDAVTQKGGRTRALRMYPEIGACEICGSFHSERHHMDSNTANNAPSNVAVLCRKCHMSTDGRLRNFHARVIAASVAARLKKTHCKLGHSLSFRGNGIRYCVTCARLKQQQKRRIKNG